MVWFQKEMNYARDSLKEAAETSIERAGNKLSDVVREGIGGASSELREVILAASHEVDEKLEKISQEISAQRGFTKQDVEQLVDYAAQRLGDTLDQRIVTLKQETADLVQQKVELFKREVDDFFVKRQQDLARERRRLLINLLIAGGASLVAAWVSWLYQKSGNAQLTLFTVFRTVFAGLTVGYVAYFAAKLARRYLRMSEHQKDLLFLSMRYWGFLRPQSVFSHIMLALLLLSGWVLLFYPPQWLMHLLGH